MTFGSVCSGIEAASVAWHPLGWKAAWLAEIEPFPCAVLAHHYPTVPNLGDMTTIIPRVLSGEVEAPDVFTGGTPCQAFSVAGKRGSLADARGNLSLTFCEIANAIDDVRAADGREPCIVVWENVPGVLSTSDNAFGCFLGALAGSGCELQPAGGRWTNAGLVLGPKRAVAWRIIDAQYFGLAQRRRRVFVVASARNGFDPAAVLFEFDGVRRDFAPSREAREGAATSTARSVALRGREGGGTAELGEDCGLTLRASSGGGDKPHVLTWPAEIACTLNASFGDKQGLEDQHVNGGGRYSSLPNVSMCLNAGAMGRQDAESETLIPTFGGGFDDAYSIRTANTSSNGWGVQHEVTHTLDQAQGLAIAHTLKGDPCHPLAAGAHPPAVAFTDMRGDNRGPGIKVTGDIANTLHCAKGQSEQQAVAWSIMPQNSGKDYKARQVEVLQPLMAGAGQYGNQGGDIIQSAMAVRRLTPRECERLQGFPDDYTLIPWRNKPASECPDGPRYKALGNSWAVPCARWIGERIQRQAAA
jgi:DNA (cytosine-5)-methyltransferase 1